MQNEQITNNKPQIINKFAKIFLLITEKLY